jgi:anaerobic selenocysteine-containing dehydrogenase
MCPVGCGIRVRVVDGRAVSIAGSAASPINRGGLCARGSAGIELLYHAERVPSPLRRLGQRGEDQWQAISRDAAIAELRGRLARLQEAGATHRVLLLDGDGQGTTHALWARFMAAIGSPNHIGHAARGSAAVVETIRRMTGTPARPAYDLARAGCIVLIGTGALESSSLAMAFARLVATGARPRILCASPRLPRSAALVDEWIAVAPGSAGRLLLGVLHVLLREGRQGAAIEDGHGFLQARAQVMAEYSPDQVAAATGVPPARIVAMAHTMAAARPAVVVVDEETQDGQAVAAAVWLNALTGLGGAGALGVLLDPPEPRGALAMDRGLPARTGPEPPALDEGPLAGRDFAARRLLAVPDALLSAKPYPVEILLLHHSNPVFAEPEGQRWAEAIARVPFVVSFSPIRDESVRCADLVLPDLSYLESWDIVTPGSGVVALRQPVVAATTQGMATGEVVLQLARALGGRIAQALPWSSLREAALARLVDVKAAPQLMDELASQGSVVLPELVQQHSGGGAASRLASDGPRATWPIIDFAPVLAEVAIPASDAAEYPFRLWPFRGHGYVEGGSLAWLAELPSAGGPYVEVAAEDACRLGIPHGDWVRVVSPAGRAELRLHVNPTIKAGVIGLALGGWGRLTGDLGGIPAGLLLATADPVTGQWLAWATPARLEKLG